MAEVPRRHLRRRPGGHRNVAEWFGYLLTPDTSQHKILFLVVDAVRQGHHRHRARRAGPARSTHTTLTTLAGEFGMEPLLGKSVAILSDVRLSGRADVMTVATERLAHDIRPGQGDREPEARTDGDAAVADAVRSALDGDPRLTDASGTSPAGHPPPVHEIIPGPGGSYTRGPDHRAELPGVLRWAIEGWRRLHARGKFVQPETGKALMRDLADLSSPVAQFVRRSVFVAIQPSARSRWPNCTPSGSGGASRRARRPAWSRSSAENSRRRVRPREEATRTEREARADLGGHPAPDPGRSRPGGQPLRRNAARIAEAARRDRIR